MRKKHLLFIIIISSFFAISNVDASEFKNTMEGLYVGANVGYSKYKIEGFAETFPPNYISRKRTELNIDDSNLLTRLYVGKGHYWDNNLFTGLELGYQKLLGSDDYKITNTTIDHEVDVKYSNRFDLGLLIGYNIFSKDLLYVRLGYGSTNINISPHDIGFTGGAFHDLSGPIYGIGYSYMLSSNWGLRVEANHLSITDSYNNDKNDGEIYDVKIKDSQSQIGFFYNF